MHMCLNVRFTKIFRYQSPLLRLFLQIRLLKNSSPKWTFIIVLQIPRRCFCSPFAASKAFLFPLTLFGGQSQSCSSLRAKETHTSVWQQYEYLSRWLHWMTSSSFSLCDFIILPHWPVCTMLMSRDLFRWSQ